MAIGGFITAARKTIVATAPSAPTGGIAALGPKLPSTLRAVPPPVLQPTSSLSGAQSPRLSIGGFTVQSAVRQNVLDELSASVAPTSSVDANVGQPGSTNNAGNIGGASGNYGYSLDTVRTFQASNPGIAMALRIGLPVAGIFALTKGHTLLGAGAIGAGALLWMSR